MIDRTQFPSDDKLFRNIPEKGKDTCDVATLNLAEWCRNKMRQEFTPAGEVADETLQKMLQYPVGSYDYQGYYKAWRDTRFSVMEMSILLFLKLNDGYIGQFPDEKIVHVLDNPLEVRERPSRTVQFNFFETASASFWPYAFQPLSEAFSKIVPAPDNLAHKRRKLVFFPLVMFVVQLLFFANGTLVQIAQSLMTQHLALEVPAICACVYWTLMLFSGALVPFLMRESRKHVLDIIWYIPLGFFLLFVGIMQIAGAAKATEMPLLSEIMCIILAIYFAIECMLLMRRAGNNKRAYEADMKKHLDSSKVFMELMERHKDDIYRYIRFLKLWDEYCGGANMVTYRNRIYKQFDEMYAQYLEYKKVQQG